MQDFASFTPALLGALSDPRSPAARPPLQRGGGSLRDPSTGLLNRFEYTSFWGSYAPVNNIDVQLSNNQRIYLESTLN